MLRLCFGVLAVKPECPFVFVCPLLVLMRIRHKIAGGENPNSVHTFRIKPEPVVYQTELNRWVEHKNRLDTIYRQTRAGPGETRSIPVEWPTGCFHFRKDFPSYMNVALACRMG